MKGRVALLSCGVALAALLTDAAPSFAQAGMEEMVVTARRREERLQTTPVAVQAFSPVEMKERGVVNLYDFQSAVPGLKVYPTTAQGDAVTFALRGQYQNDNLLTLDPSIGIYLDDIYLARAYGVTADLVDLERVEVLKGPQGTLYGRNTTGGAIKFISKKADPSAGYTGFVKGQFGNYNLWQAQAAINLPFSNKFAVRFSGSRTKHDGYTQITTVQQNATLTPIAQQDSDDQNTQFY